MPLLRINWLNILSGRVTGPYGPVLNVSNCVNLNFTTFTNATPTGFDATSDGSGQHAGGTADEIPFVNGDQYITEFDLVLNSGTLPRWNIGSDWGSGISVEGLQVAASGFNSVILTSNTTTTGVITFISLTTPVNFSITNLSVRRVL